MQTKAYVTARLDGVCGGSKYTNSTDPILYIPCITVLTLSHSQATGLQTARFGPEVPSSGIFKFRAEQAPKKIDLESKMPNITILAWNLSVAL